MLVLWQPTFTGSAIHLAFLSAHHVITELDTNFLYFPCYFSSCVTWMQYNLQRCSPALSANELSFGTMHMFIKSLLWGPCLHQQQGSGGGIKGRNAFNLISFVVFFPRASFHILSFISLLLFLLLWLCSLSLSDKWLFIDRWMMTGLCRVHRVLGFKA